MLWSAAPPVPPAAAFRLTATAVAVAFVVVMELPGFMVKLSAPAPSVLALIVTVPDPAPPTFALRVTASPLDSVIAPLPVDIGEATVNVPAVLVSVMGPAPAAVALKLAPFDSVMKTPPEPATAVMLSAEVSTGVPDTPMLLAPEVGVARFTAPVPTLRSVAAV